MLLLEGLASPEKLKVVYACYDKNTKISCGNHGLNDALEVKLPSGNLLTSSNSAVRYLYESSNKDESAPSSVLNWLEWEFAQLRPLVEITVVSGEGKSALGEDLCKKLLFLDEKLKNDDTLSDNNIASCVIVCCLSPLLVDGAFVGVFTSKFPSIFEWFSKISAKSCFIQAWENVTGKQGRKAFEKYYSSLKPKPVVKASKESSKAETHNAVKADIAEQSSENVRASVSAEEIAACEHSWNSASTLPKLKEKCHPVLPVEGERNVLITSALPYVNNVPHLGNIIGCVLSADVFARYCRLRQWNTLYICGTDEYGTATETKAAQEGVTPQQICDKYNKIHDEVYQWFCIGFDYFGRTTTPQQTAISQDIFWHLHRNKYLVQNTVEQLYCGKCERFLADRFVEGTCPLCNFDDARGDQCDKCGKLLNAVELKSPRCKICSDSPEHRNSEHLFIDLTKLEPMLRESLKDLFKGEGWSSNAKTITETWLRDGIKPRCITRDLKWGTPVPLEGFTDKVFYVWFDAPIGYFSITANYTDEWEKWWKNPKNVQCYNFMAKDNVPFHSVVFPSCLLGTDDDYTLVNHLNATEYLNYEDGKFSKSRGVGVFGDHAAQTDIPADIWRFYLLYMRPEGQDTHFSWGDFMLKNNSELLNNLGNFVNRSLKFVANFYGGIIPKANITDADLQLMALVNREIRSYINDMTNIKLRDNLKRILNISRLGNQYVQENQPWKLIKGSEDEKARAATVTCIAANLSCLISVLMEPYMPNTSREIQRQLNAPEGVNILCDDAAFMCLLSPGHKINDPSPLFRKVEEKEINSYRDKFRGKPKENLNEKKEVKPDKAEDAQMEASILKQGGIVRDLKANKADKDEIGREVAKLLELKKQLAISRGEDIPAKPKKGNKNKK